MPLKNSGLTNQQIQIVFINTFLGGTQLLGLAKKIEKNYNCTDSLDELIISESELRRIINFGCALEEFAYEFMVNPDMSQDPWDTLERFLAEPLKHLSQLCKYGTHEFRQLCIEANKNLDNFMKNYWVAKEEVITGLYNVSAKQKKEIKDIPDKVRIFEEPDYSYEWD